MSPSKPLEEVRQVLSHYAIAVTRIEALGGAGGFSGAEFWRIHEPDNVWCLRCWPQQHPNRERLAFIHAVLRSVARQGLEIVAAPLPTRQGETFLRSGGHLWELARWLPGAPASRATVNPEQLRAAMHCLATFHLYAAEYQQSVGAAPGIVERSERLVELQRGMLQRIQDACRQPPWPALAQRVDPIIRGFQVQAPRMLQQLADATQFRLPLQPCIRDIWSDHVLFTANEVSGLIDFGAMRLEHVAADIARLLGSLVGDEQEARLEALQAYVQTRPLGEQELLLLTTYDRSSTVLSGMNWLQWICLERRQFPNREQVLQRLDEIIQRLDSLDVT